MKTISDLRQNALKTIQDFQSGKIEIDEAAATAKLYESVISSCKIEMEYHKFLKRMANIEFLEGAPLINVRQLLDNSDPKLIE